MIFQRKKKTFILVKIKYEEQLEMLTKSDIFLNFQIFNIRFEFFDELD